MIYKAFIKYDIGVPKDRRLWFLLICFLKGNTRVITQTALQTFTRGGGGLLLLQLSAVTSAGLFRNATRTPGQQHTTGLFKRQLLVFQAGVPWCGGTMPAAATRLRLRLCLRLRLRLRVRLSPRLRLRLRVQVRLRLRLRFLFLPPRQCLSLPSPLLPSRPRLLHGCMRCSGK